MKKLIISNTLEEKERKFKGSWESQDIDICSWRESTDLRLSDYGIAILDLNFHQNSLAEGMFEGKQMDIYKMLDVGGVIICLNHSTYFTDTEGDKYDTNYHWFAEFNPELVDIYAKPGKNIKLVSKENVFKEYFKGVTQYHKTLTSCISGEKFYFLFLKWRVIKSMNYFQNFFPSRPWDEICRELSYNLYNSYEGEVIAINGITGEPIASAVNCRKGNLIFLPENTKSSSTFLIPNLCEIGEKYYERNREKIWLPSEVPDWLEEYKTDQEKEIEKQISSLKEHADQLKQGKKKFEEIDVLLHGYDKPLVNAVQKVFEDWGCEVTPTQPGATIDLKVKEPIKNLQFALEITGTINKINKKSYKVSQALQHLTQREKDEKIVILANTYREKKIAERLDENFTQPVIEIAEINKFCLMTTADVYFLWQDLLNGKRSKEEIIQSIFDTVGAYKY